MAGGGSQRRDELNRRGAECRNGGASHMDLPSPMPMRLEAGRYRTARSLVSALFLLACAACGMASLSRGESVAAAPSALPAPARHAADSAVLRIAGRRFVGPDGRVVLLRGVNLGGDGKIPPFSTPDDPVLLDRLIELGFNAIRLAFIWEAYEPEAAAMTRRTLRGWSPSPRRRGHAGST